MWELNYKESWAPKNWCSWTVTLEKTLASPLDCKEIKPVNTKGNQSWIFIGRMKLKLQNSGHLMRSTDSFEKTLMLGKIEGGRRRGQQRMRYLDSITDSIIIVPIAQRVKRLPTMRESQVGKSPGEGNGNPLQYPCLEKSHGPRSLVGCSPWGRKELDMTERLHFTSLHFTSPTQWTWVWVISGSWWWTGRPGVLHSVESQRVGHDRMTELNWTDNPTILIRRIKSKLSKKKEETNVKEKGRERERKLNRGGRKGRDFLPGDRRSWICL